MARSKRVIQKYIDFSGGHQSFTSPLLLQVNESPFLYNVDIGRPGKLLKSYGFAQIGSGVGSGANRGVYAWNKEDGTNELYQVYGSDLYKYQGTASGFTSVGSGFGTGTGPVEWGVSFINTGTGVGTGADTFKERLYITQGIEGEVKYTDGTNMGTLASTYAKHLEVYKGRLYLGNVKTNTNTYPSRVIFSDVSRDNFPANNYFDDMGEAIVGLKEYSGALFVFTQNKVGAWDEYSLRVINTNGGTSNKETVQVTEGKMLWYNRGGVYMYAGGTEGTLISRAVEDWLSVVAEANSVTGGLDSRGRYCLHIGDVTYQSVSYKNVILVYDVLLNAWSVLINRPYKYWTRNKAGGVYEVYTTNPDGQEIWQIDLGYALNGSAQGSVYQTPKLYGSPENVEDIKNAYEVHVVYKPSNASGEYLTAQYRIGGTGNWCSIEGSGNNISLAGTDEIRVERLVLPPRAAGKFVELKLSHSSSGVGFSIYGLNLIYDVEAKEAH